jgi:hypothetical protein
MSDTTDRDRELLERAAEAAGYTMHGWIGERFVLNFGDGERGAWNPLTSDGDALRLAVKLHLNVECLHIGASVTFKSGHPDEWSFVNETSVADQRDLCSMTRRAIVRAAAALSHTATDGEEGKSNG